MLGSKGDTDLKNRLLDTVGDGEGGMIWENIIETYTFPYVKQTDSGSLIIDAGDPKPVLCENLDAWSGREGVSKGRGHVYLRPIHADVWQKPLQYYKVIVLKSLSHVQPFETPWTVAHQTPLFMGILQARILEWVAISFFNCNHPPIKHK